MENFVIELPDLAELNFYSSRFWGLDTSTVLASFTLWWYTPDYWIWITQERVHLQLENLVWLFSNEDDWLKSTIEIPCFNPNRKAYNLSLDVRAKIKEISKNNWEQHQIAWQILCSATKTELFLEGITWKFELVATFQ